MQLQRIECEYADAIGRKRNVTLKVSSHPSYIMGSGHDDGNS